MATPKELYYSYNFFNSKLELMKLLKNIIPESHLIKYSKHQLKKILNDYILQDYRGELYFKYKLIEYFINDNANLAFEIKTLNKRLDFLRINGFSESYEIKSDIDNLTKLNSQIDIYERLFEFNNIVIGENHYSKIFNKIPHIYGIYLIIDGQVKQIKKPIKNKKISPQYQLKIFTKKELKKYFNYEDIDFIISNVEPDIINEKFKENLNNRYKSKWEFIKTNFNEILPIDLKFFYRYNIPPHVYYKDI